MKTGGRYPKSFLKSVPFEKRMHAESNEILRQNLRLVSRWCEKQVPTQCPICGRWLSMTIAENKSSLEIVVACESGEERPVDFCLLPSDTLIDEKKLPDTLVPIFKMFIFDALFEVIGKMHFSLDDDLEFSVSKTQAPLLLAAARFEKIGMEHKEVISLFFQLSNRLKPLKKTHHWNMVSRGLQLLLTKWGHVMPMHDEKVAPTLPTDAQPVAVVAPMPEKVLKKVGRPAGTHDTKKRKSRKTLPETFGMMIGGALSEKTCSDVQVLG